MTLPNFLLVGAAKAGTTSIYHYLRQHPDVFLPGEIKETFFFSGLNEGSVHGPGAKYLSRSVTSLEEYEKLYNSTSGEAAIGEACVGYLYFHKQSIPRILDILGGDTKIVICLRDPVSRAFSNYMHHRRDGIEDLSFEEGLEQEAVREGGGQWWGFQYRKAGLYYEQVKSYIDAFGADKVLVLVYEDFEQDMTAAVRVIFDFIGVDSSVPLNASVRHNASGLPRSRLINDILFKDNLIRGFLRSVIPAQVRYRVHTSDFVRWIRTRNLKKVGLDKEAERELYRFFRDDIDALSELLERDLSVWKHEY